MTTKRVNDYLNQASTLQRILIQSAIIVGAVAGILLFPLNSRIAGVEKDVAQVKAETRERCEKIEDTLKDKASKKEIELTIQPLQKDIQRIDDNVEKIIGYIATGKLARSGGL